MKVINPSNDPTLRQKISICRFAGMLALQLINNSKHLGATSSHFRPEDDLNELVRLISVVEPSRSGVSDLSSPDFASSSEKNIAHSLKDVNGRARYLVKYDIMKDPSGRSRCKKRKCKMCYEKGKWRDVSYYCITCGESFSFCIKGDGRDCFKAHVKHIRCKMRHSGNSP
jgi:hypothetical protein